MFCRVLVDQACSHKVFWSASRKWKKPILLSVRDSISSRVNWSNSSNGCALANCIMRRRDWRIQFRVCVGKLHHAQARLENTFRLMLLLDVLEQGLEG